MRASSAPRCVLKPPGVHAAPPGDPKQDSARGLARSLREAAWVCFASHAASDTPPPRAVRGRGLLASVSVALRSWFPKPSWLGSSPGRTAVSRGQRSRRGPDTVRRPIERDFAAKPAMPLAGRMARDSQRGRWRRAIADRLERRPHSGPVGIAADDKSDVTLDRVDVGDRWRVT